MRNLPVFRPSREVAELVVHAMRSGDEIPPPDLHSRYVPRGDREVLAIQQVRTAIGERLMGMLGTLARRQAAFDREMEHLVVLNGKHHFSREVEDELVDALGLSREATGFRDGLHRLADEFYRWTNSHSRARKRMQLETDRTGQLLRRISFRD